MIFGFGLIAPLTPSEGKPSVIEVLIFLVAPLLLSGGGLYCTRKTSERIFVSVVFFVILVVAAILFSGVAHGEDQVLILTIGGGRSGRGADARFARCSLAGA
jgi:small basic protein